MSTGGWSTPLLRTVREDAASRFEAGSAICVEGNRGAGCVQPDQIDRRLKELQLRLWLSYAATDDDTLVLFVCQCLNDAAFSRRV